jgi:hypothetical protein
MLAISAASTSRAVTVRAAPSSCGTPHISLTPPSLTNDRRGTDWHRSDESRPGIDTGAAFTCR